MRPRARDWLAMRRDARLIRASGLFDADWYATVYPDIRARDAVWHYLSIGAAEGRSPGMAFDGPAYLDDNPDALVNGINPLVHYIRQGRAAGRPVRPVRPAPPPDKASAGAEPIVPLPVIEPGACFPEADWCLVLAPGVRVIPGALRALARETTDHAAIDLLTMDGDAVGGRVADGLKPGWDPDLLLATGYVGGFAARTGVLRALWPRSLPNYATVASRLAVALPASRVRHVSLTALEGAPASWDWRAADAVARGIGGRVEPNGRLRFPLPDPAPSVSVVIPTRDRPDLLRRCVAGLLRRTAYPSLELVIVDNGSRDAGARRLLDRLAVHPRATVLRRPGPFDWSALTNAGVEAARGDMLVLMNNDVFVRHPDWLTELVGHAARPEVGAVGATLLFPNGTIQHAGIVLQAPGLASHLSRHAPADDPGPCGAFRAVRQVSGVTGACMALRRSVFEAVGGLAEGALPVTFNDVDLSLRIRVLGLRVLCTPFARLTHLEGVSRGPDNTPERVRRRTAEWRWLRDRWGAFLDIEPHLNPAYAVIQERARPRPPRLSQA